SKIFQWQFSNNVLPPFYMMAYEIGGTPRISLLGTNESDLKWTADHPIVDSEGTAGGISPQLYTVVISANVTTSVNTCDPWGLRIRGGVKPYNITFLQINSPIVTNVTLGPNDDAFTYINRGDPGKLFVAAVNDL
ncbi:hypothetical protein MPER_03864, partial [Moniliophthora perniciosa FA553]